MAKKKTESSKHKQIKSKHYNAKPHSSAPVRVRILKTKGNANSKRLSKNNHHKSNSKLNNKQTQNAKPSKQKTLKHSLLHMKAKKQKTSFKEDDEHIELIDQENKLYQDGYYNVEDEVAKEEWTPENNNLNVNLYELLTNKMDDINETELDPQAIEKFKDLGVILSRWTSGKLPKLFGVLPGLEQWREYIVFTNPKRWTPHSMYEAVCMFASNMNNTLVEGFYRDFFVPNIRDDIKANGKLNLYLYNGLKKAIFKPAGFFKGIIFPLAENLTFKEANIIGSILKRCSIPIAHSAAALSKLMELNGETRVSQGHFFFIKLLLMKKYALPTIVKSKLVSFLYDVSLKNHQLNVCYHQVLLCLVQTYKFDLTDQERSIIQSIIKTKGHQSISEELIKELNYKKIN